MMWGSGSEWMLGFILRAEIFSQEVLKFALHRKYSNFFFFLKSCMLSKPRASRRDNQTCLECTNHRPGIKLSHRQHVQ